MGTYYMFGMSYCKTDECKELISGYSFALMVLKNKLFLKIKKKNEGLPNIRTCHFF